MHTKKQWLKSTVDVFNKMKQDTVPYHIEVLGKKITVLPGVFSPKYFTDSQWFAREIPKIVKHKSFLEIGTGTGIVALCVSIGGASSVVASDINPDAVKNAKKNFTDHGAKISVRKGNIFTSIKTNERFDFVFWNHPFNYSPHRPADMLLRAGLDYRYEGLKLFFKNAANHLNTGGKLLLGTGNIARINLVKKIARENGFTGKLLKKKITPIQHGSTTMMSIMIYEFTLVDAEPDSAKAPYFTYILKCSDNSLYVGSTTNLERRMREHNDSKKGARYTKTRRPVSLAYSETFQSRSEAQKREAEIKKMKREEKLRLLSVR